jgi:two-component system CheB/CheR fusion protein
MTPEEIERAIETLLNNQANYELQLERTNRQLEQTNDQLERTNRQLERTDSQVERTNIQVEQMNERVGVLAESQREFMQVVIQHIESQGEINKSIRGSIRDLSNTVERYISEGRNGKS